MVSEGVIVGVGVTVGVEVGNSFENIIPLSMPAGEGIE